MKQIVHVAKQAIQINNLRGTNDPAIIVRDYKGATRHHQVELVTKDGQVVAKFIHDQENPLQCGAKVWLEVDTDVCEARPVL